MLTIYTLPQCVQCNAAKRYFDKRGITYTLIDLSTSPKDAHNLRDKGFTAAPVITDGTRWITGFRPSEYPTLTA